MLITTGTVHPQHRQDNSTPHKALDNLFDNLLLDPSPLVSDAALQAQDMGTGVPGNSLKMSQALAAQLGPQVCQGSKIRSHGVCRRLP